MDNLFFAAVLGLSAGFAPGPLLALVMSQTIQYGLKEGAKVAITPLLTDVPIIILGFIALSSLPSMALLLGVLSLIGAVFLVYLGLLNFRQQRPHVAVDEHAASYLKGAFVNLLSPHPYLFWFAVGVPAMLKADTLKGATAFAIVFFVCLCGSKVLVAGLVERSTAFISSKGYIYLLRGFGVLLIGFAVKTFYDGWRLLSEGQGEWVFH